MSSLHRVRFLEFTNTRSVCLCVTASHTSYLVTDPLVWVTRVRNKIQVDLTFSPESGFSLPVGIVELSTHSTLSRFPNELFCASEHDCLVYLFISVHRRCTRCEHGHHICQLREATPIGLDWITEPYFEAYESDLRVALSAKLP